MTWASSGVRALNVLLLLPLVVTRLDVSDVAVWYVFLSILSLQSLADMGFAPTFVRLIALADSSQGRMLPERLKGIRQVDALLHGNSQERRIEGIWATMRHIYKRLSIGSGLVLAIAGTVVVWQPINASSDPERAWLAWGVVVVGAVVVLRGNAFAAYLLGLNEVALVRRWEALMGGAAVCSSAAVLVAGGGLLSLAVMYQAWLVLNVVRNWLLARWVRNGLLKTCERSVPPSAALRQAWHTAWRSGVGMAMGQVPLQFTGLVFAQTVPASASAAYLVSLNLLTSIRGFSMAPFYSKLPTLARLRGTGQIEELERVAGLGMLLSYWVFFVLSLGVLIGGEPLLALIGSSTGLVSPEIWWTLSLAMLIERYGAMHLQLYSTTNHIIWHTVNGAAGVAFILISLLLFPTWGVWAFASGYLVSYAVVYAPMCAQRSYGSLPSRGIAFEKFRALPVLFAMLSAGVAILWT